jgi:hypothetical protein
MADTGEQRPTVVDQPDPTFEELLTSITTTPLRVIENQEFRGQDVHLDGRHFRNCAFIDCQVITKLGRFIIENPPVFNVRVSITGVAGELQGFVDFFQRQITYQILTAAGSSDRRASMQALFNQIHWAVENNAYYLGLYASLTLPDICGAMSSENGWATQAKYVAWFNKYVGPRYPGGIFTGDDCYNFRCSLLHQGRTQHPSGRYSRILFVEPGPQNRGNVFHRNIMNDALNIDVRIFCGDLLFGAQQWLEEVWQSPEFERNYEQYARRYPNGLTPYIVGLPVVS